MADTTHSYNDWYLLYLDTHCSPVDAVGLVIECILSCFCKISYVWAKNLRGFLWGLKTRQWAIKLLSGVHRWVWPSSRVRANKHTLKEFALEPFKTHSVVQMSSTSNEAAVMLLPLNSSSALLWGVCWHLHISTETTASPCLYGQIGLLHVVKFRFLHGHKMILEKGFQSSMFCSCFWQIWNS